MLNLIEKPEIVVTEKIEDVIKNAIIRYGDKHNKPDPLVTILDGVNECPYLNYSGLSAIFGAQKSRKTFYLSLVMSAAVGNTTIDDKLRGHTYGKKNIWFDTEQTKYYASRIPYRVVNKLNINKHPDNFEMLSIKKYGTEDRIRIIEHYMDNIDNLGLVVIDGVRDLVKDFNSVTECTDLINKLMRWVDNTNCHICSVLHVNPLKKGDDPKPRGHIGTELQNKVESSMYVEKSNADKNISIVSPRDFRDKDIEPMMLTIDSYGIPTISDIDKFYDDAKETF